MMRYIVTRSEQLIYAFNTYKLSKVIMLSSLREELSTWKNELKKKAINPRMTAELTAVTLLIFSFQQALSSNSISAP
jgi:triphosphoribosyl-dephospho-CoA synthetase